ncbi:MAG: class I SAM-dependent methyltransferase [Firmicutes bacterium]|nr:class I SAM-dependent methyltransferase [Bacillota bacterium]
METNILRDTTALAKIFCQQYINENSVAVDATCGNGHDALWLAQRCGKVYAFDIQKEAAEATESLVAAHGLESVQVINDGHEKMSAYINEPVDLFMFNLGYLPGGDKTITTAGETTLQALEKALELLKKDGLICVVMYWGHHQGAAERKAVLDWAASLDKGLFHCIHTDMINQPNCPPEILLVTKKR